MKQETEQGKTGRLFFAIVPDQATRLALYQYARMIRLDGSEKVTPPDMLHITLRYIGPVKSDVYQCLLQKIEEIECSGFHIDLKKVGFWKKPQITWCGPELTEPVLMDLVHQIEDVCSICGISAEQREYLPHITLLRKSLRRDNGTLRITAGWNVKDFVLIESISTSTGVRYKVLKTWRLNN